MRKTSALALRNRIRSLGGKHGTVVLTLLEFSLTFFYRRLNISPSSAVNASEKVFWLHRFRGLTIDSSEVNGTAFSDLGFSLGPVKSPLSDESRSRLLWVFSDSFGSETTGLPMIMGPDSTGQ